MVQKTSTSRDLAWLLDDLVERVAHAQRGIVLSTDGLLIASSKGLTREEAEHLAAAASGFQSLARGTGRAWASARSDRPSWSWRRRSFSSRPRGNGACLAVQASSEADVGLIAYEMARLVTAVGKFLSTPLRAGRTRRDR